MVAQITHDYPAFWLRTESPLSTDPMSIMTF